MSIFQEPFFLSCPLYRVYFIELQTRLDEAEAKLQAREITMEKAGSIADAAVQLSGVFQAAQEAADTYLKSIKAKEKELARLIKQAKKNMRD